jgi:hypothetical protein
MADDVPPRGQAGPSVARRKTKTIFLPIHGITDGAER